MSALDPNFEQQRKSAMSAFAHDRHKRVARTLGFALTLHDGPAWAAFTAIAAARLTVAERAAMAGAALLALDPDEAEGVIQHLFTGAGYPLPALLAPLPEARIWAAAANQSELKAYALAAFEAMPTRGQSAFCRHITAERRAT